MDNTDIKQRNIKSIILFIAFILALSTSLTAGYFIENILFIFVLGAVVAGRFKSPILIVTIGVFTAVHAYMDNIGYALATVLLIGFFVISISLAVENRATLKRAVSFAACGFGVGLTSFVFVQMHRYFGEISFAAVNSFFSRMTASIKAYMTYYSDYAADMGIEQTQITAAIKNIDSLAPLLKSLTIGLLCMFVMSVAIVGVFITYKSSYGRNIKVLYEFDMSKSGAVIMMIIIFALVFVSGDTMIKLMNVYLAFLPAFIMRGIRAIINIVKRPLGQGAILVAAFLFFILTSDITLALAYLAAFDCLRRGGGTGAKL